MGLFLVLMSPFMLMGAFIMADIATPFMIVAAVVMFLGGLRMCMVEVGLSDHT